MHGNRRHVARRGHAHKGVNVAFMRMHAAGRQQANHVYLATGLYGRVAGACQRGVLREFAGFDGVVNAGEVLIDHPASAQVEVADLGIAELPVRQANMVLRGVDQAVRAVAPQGIPGGLAGERDGVVRRWLTVAKAVQNQQDDGVHGGGGRRAHGGPEWRNT